MKKTLILICVIILVAIVFILTKLTNIEGENINNKNEKVDNNSAALDSDEILLDYNDAASFENALNSGKKVSGKTVKFDVKKYVPNSTLGINCWSGEHLNFISDKELDVKTGDIIIGRVKEEPTSFLGSWKIEYVVIEIQHNEEKNDEDKNISDKNIENEIKNENIENSKIEKNTESSTKITNENELSEEINKTKYNYYTTNDNENAKKGNTGKYSYVKRNGSYKIYWVIDFDEGYVYNFTEGNGDNSCEKIKIKSGDLNGGLELHYKNSNNAWVKYVHFKYTNQPHQLIIVDNDYFEYEYSTTSLENVLDLMKNKTIWEP